MIKGLITVIVPIYKSEKYLNKCVNSILAQTYPHIEVILVNDGAPDGSALLCDEYAKKDDRIKVIHKENGGVSSARNAGLDAASGEYVGFVDSDDFVDEDMYESMIKSIVDTGADIACCGYRTVYDRYYRLVKVPYVGKLSVTLFFECLLEDFRRYYQVAPTGVCNKLFRADLIHSHGNIRFPVDMTEGEDGWFSMDLISKSINGLVFVDITPYHYVISANPGSASKTGGETDILKLLDYIKRRMINVLPDSIEAIDNLFEFQKSVLRATLVHGQNISSLPKRYKLDWRTTKAILGQASNYEEKLSALLLYLLPSGIYRFVFRLYCKLTTFKNNFM